MLNNMTSKAAVSALVLIATIATVHAFPSQNSDAVVPEADSYLVESGSQAHNAARFGQPEDVESETNFGPIMQPDSPDTSTGGNPIPHLTRAPTREPTPAPTPKPTPAPTYPALNDNTFRSALTKWHNTGASVSLGDVEYGDITRWNTREVTDFRGAVDYLIDKTTFNADISQWDVSSGTNFAGMFNGATSFNQPLDNWVVSSGTDFGGMFHGATSFNQPLNNWDVSSGTNFRGMFAGATDFNQPLNNWNVCSGTHFRDMFRGATSFDQTANDPTSGDPNWRSKCATLDQPQGLYDNIYGRD